MIRTSVIVLAGLCFGAAGAQAQSSYATHSGAVAATTSTDDRVERVYSAPAYEPYKPTAFDATAYDAATKPAPAPMVAVPQDGGGRPYGEPVDVTPQDEFVALPQPTYAPQVAPPTGEIGFQQETETSRLLIALDDTYAKRVAEIKGQHAAQRRAMLAQFEVEANDPAKVIGLADRMRSAMAGLDAAQKAALAVEERQYTDAMLKVIDTAPSRVE